MKLSLASALAVIGKESDALESRADSVLKIVKAKKIGDVRTFNAEVRKAYRANGWNGKPGKPKAGAETAPVPATVKQYVSTIRRAYRHKLLVTSFSSFYALKAELKAAAAKARKPRSDAPRLPETAGIRLAQPDSLTGDPFHDLVVLYTALDRKRKPLMMNALDRVKRQFASSAPQLVLAAGTEMRKAA